MEITLSMLDCNTVLEPEPLKTTPEAEMVSSFETVNVPGVRRTAPLNFPLKGRADTLSIAVWIALVSSLPDGLTVTFTAICDATGRSPPDM